MEKLNKIILIDIDDTLFNTDKFIKSKLQIFEVYEEVHEALKALAKIATLGILSQGKIAFQNKKLDETHIKEYFVEEHTHIVEVKVDVFKELLHSYQGKGRIYFIEDRLDTLRMAKKSDSSIVAIWMKRGRHAPSQKDIPGFKPDFTISNLREVIPLIEAE